MDSLLGRVAALVVALRAFALGVRINDIELEIMELQMEGKSCTSARERLKSAIAEREKLWLRK